MSIEPIRRKRAFLPKVKTGCKTCKSRKVKCGEEKPFCRRCTSTGRKCEGYARETSPSSTTASTAPVRTSTPNIQLQVSSGVESWFESDKERRSFHFYLTHAGLRLGGFWRDPFWTREVVSAGIHYPSIRHLVVALGSAYEYFEGRQTDPSQMEFALQQSNQSIRHLTLSSPSSLTKQSVESSSTLVTASLLFTILSSISGQMADAMDHVRAGLRVLQTMEYEQANSDDGSSTSSDQSLRSVSPASAYPVPISRLRSLLTSLWLQCRVMVSDEDAPGWQKDPLLREIDYPTCFASLDDAKDHVESLFGNQVTLFHRIAALYPLTDEDIAEAQAQQDALVYALDCSRASLDAFVERHREAINPEDEASMNLLRLYHLYLGIRMGVGILQEDTRELAFDQYEPQFEQMLSYCSELLESGETLRPSCSSGLGVVIPLHMIGHRCRNPLIRSEAVELLLKASRREGLWDSSIVGRIAATTSSLEQDSEMLEQWRVREVKTQFIDDHRARLTFVSGDTGSNQRIYRREIAW